MSDLMFSIDGSQPVEYAAVPQLAFKLRIEQAEPRKTIHTIALWVQIRIEPTKRHYDRECHVALADLFGQPDRWGQTLRSMLWQHATVVVPGFKEHTAVDLTVPCSFDFNVAATKYFQGLNAGEIPLSFLFSGTIFYEDDEGQLKIAQIPWDREASFRLPVRTWQEMRDHYYPNSAWLCLDRGTFQALSEFKHRHGLPTWDQAIDRLVATDSAATTIP